MSTRQDVSPVTLPVELREDGIEVEYLDDRSVFYHGVPAKRTGAVRTAPGKLVQVLVTDPSETEGVLTYVNDHKTRNDILEATGVGRVLLEDGEETTVFPGVTVRDEAYRVVVEADLATADGRVFVFEEDDLGERSFELVESED
jgi:hypothetical protein